MTSSYRRALGKERPRRWPWAVASLLAVCAVLATGIGIGRATASATRAPRAPSAAGPSTSVAGWPGATRMDGDVPVGYAHTQQGAVMAATNFDRIITGPIAFHPDQYRAAIKVLGAPSWNFDVERELSYSAPYTAAAAQGHTVVDEPFQLTYHVDVYADDHARVTLVGGGVIGADQTLPTVIDVVPTTYDLSWDGDWRVAGWATGDAPPLQPGNPAPQSSQLPDVLRHTTGGYSYAPR